VAAAGADRAAAEPGTLPRDAEPAAASDAPLASAAAAAARQDAIAALAERRPDEPDGQTHPSPAGVPCHPFFGSVAADPR
jgi:hypothetical protein